MSEEIVYIPLDDPTSRVRYGNVGTVVYRDTVHDVRFTAHTDPTVGLSWIVRHEPTDRSDTDGVPVARSVLFEDVTALNIAWTAVRSAPTASRLETVCVKCAKRIWYDEGDWTAADGTACGGDVSYGEHGDVYIGHHLPEIG